ncbi:hypothetical protein EVAR_70252_1 [Eumeta japonica]|uniref:Uncharacterized protein n=1 Tax=Eumeta variegata TaxID=151549 RepID=A0A4C2A565_EUMVA|nr:hypothetical protein EVAR_70252_1 [Eumeta japonica]
MGSYWNGKLDLLRTGEGVTGRRRGAEGTGRQVLVDRRFSKSINALEIKRKANEQVQRRRAAPARRAARGRAGGRVGRPRRSAGDPLALLSIILFACSFLNPVISVVRNVANALTHVPCANSCVSYDFGE